MNHLKFQRGRSALFLIVLILSLVLAACAAPAPAPATTGTTSDTPAASDTTESASDTAAPADASADTAASDEEVTIAVSGAFALYPLAIVWGEEYSAEHPNVHFDIQGGGAGKGMTDVLSGAVDVAMLSRTVRQEELDLGAVVVPVTIDSVLGSVNAANPNLADIQRVGITPETGLSIWVSQTITTWGGFLGTDSTDPIHLYTRSDAAGAAESWVKFFDNSLLQEDLNGTAVNADPGLAEAVRQDTLAIGFNNVGFLYNPETGLPNDGLAVVPIDFDGDGTISEEEQIYDTRDEFIQAVRDGKYPFPPARVLYFVTKGEPSDAVRGWYEYVLNQGQELVVPNGYVPLTQDVIDEARATLDGE